MWKGQCHVVAWFTIVPGPTWLRTKQPIYTLFAVLCAYVLGAADTWLGYISALVTKRHEPRGGNHGSRDFCQRCTPVIAKSSAATWNTFQSRYTFSQGSRWRFAQAKTPEITSWGSQVNLDLAQRVVIHLTDVCVTKRMIHILADFSVKRSVLILSGFIIYTCRINTILAWK